MPDHWCCFGKYFFSADWSEKSKMKRAYGKNEIPEFFSYLLSLGLIEEKHLEKTDDGFICVSKCISDILALKGIDTFTTSSGRVLRCEDYFDDWYVYAVKNADAFVYSLFKLREQEYDMYEGETADRDAPGVTVSFIAFAEEIFRECIEKKDEKSVRRLSDEINRVVAYSHQKHHPALKKYFIRAEAKAPYLIAEMYIRHILSFTHKGFILVPQRYEEIYSEGLTFPSGHKIRRLPDFIEKNNADAGYTVCDQDKIYIKNPEEPTYNEKLAILATHTADTSFNCFACEVQYHAKFLNSLAKVRIPFLGKSVYESAIRADLSVDDSEFEGNAPYHREDSALLRKHREIHGSY